MKELYPWQQNQWGQLLSQCRQGRLPQALLVGGPAGLGKWEFAQRFAHYLLCKEPAAGQACRCCAGCRLILAGNHPDLLSIVPEEKSSAIKVEQIRSLILKLNQTAQRVGYQVAIIAPAEAMNKAAANALLKTLEEPVGRVVLLLVSHLPGALPATIRSRCQQIRFTGADNADDWLRNQLQAAQISADANLLLKIAEYAPLRALDLAQHHYLSLRDDLLTHLVMVCQRKAALLAPVAEFLKTDLLLWLEAFTSVILDMMRLRLGVPGPALTNSDRLTQLQQLVSMYPLSVLPPLLTRLIQARRFLLNSQVHLNEQLLLESLLIHWEFSKPEAGFSANN